MKISFIGDVFLDSDVLKKINKEVFWSDFNSSELIVLNFEAAVTSSKSVRVNKKYNFKVTDEAVSFFKDRPVVFNLANNHIMDFGQQGLDDTLNILKDNNIKFCGVGCDLVDAQKGVSVQLANKRVYVIGTADPRFQSATLNSSGTLPAERDNLKMLINKACKDHDLVIVTIHAGTEYSAAPSPYQIEIAHLCIDSGAHVIQYHHAHCLSGVEHYKNGLIMYGTGNFVFPYNLSIKYKKWFESAIFEVCCDFSSELKLDLNIHPVKLDKQGLPSRADKLLNEKIIKNIKTASHKIEHKKLTLWRITELLKPSYILISIVNYGEIISKNGFRHFLRIVFQAVKIQFRF